MFILPYKLLGFIAGINCLFYNLLVIPDNDFIVLFCVQFHMFRTVNMILKLKKNLALYNHIYSWCSYYKGTSSFDSPQSSLLSRFYSFFPAITGWCFFILFIYIFFSSPCLGLSLECACSCKQIFRSNKSANNCNEAVK